MSIFGKIKDAIFGHHLAAAAPAPSTSAPAPAPEESAGSAAGAAVGAAVAQVATQQAQPVDVEAVLHDIWVRKGSPASNYETSIVDLMKLLDLDSSLPNREQLATELGYTGAKDGSAAMNIWLIKQVMTELEKNGGKVPADLKG